MSQRTDALQPSAVNVSGTSATIEEVAFFLDWCHMDPEWIAAKLGYRDAENLRQTLHRHGREDLAARLMKEAA